MSKIINPLCELQAALSASDVNMYYNPSHLLTITKQHKEAMELIECTHKQIGVDITSYNLPLPALHAALDFALELTATNCL